MDDLTPIEFPPNDALPAGVRARVRRRRVVRRLRAGGGVALVLLLGAALSVQIARPIPTGGAPANPHSPLAAGTLIGIDDPMFRGMDMAPRRQPVDRRWRAGARPEIDWVLGL